MRIDVWLVENGFAPSRQKAQELIAAGRVTAGSQSIKKPSVLVTEAIRNSIRVEPSTEPEFVSRGGTKLLGAVRTLGLESKFENAIALDIGISTGGFSDCALYLGAKRIVGIDVGHGQLAEKLKNDPRVTLYEGLNARDLSGDDRFDIVVIDVSFISLKLILPSAAKFLKESGDLIALVKPQFEVGREGLGRGGIVKDAKLYPIVETSIRDVCASLGLRVISFIDSPILGSDGNREFFIHATAQNRDDR